MGWGASVEIFWVSPSFPASKLDTPPWGEKATPWWVLLHSASAVVVVAGRWMGGSERQNDFVAITASPGRLVPLPLPRLTVAVGARPAPVGRRGGSGSPSQGRRRGGLRRAAGGGRGPLPRPRRAGRAPARGARHRLGRAAGAAQRRGPRGPPEHEVPSCVVVHSRMPLQWKLPVPHSVPAKQVRNQGVCRSEIF